MKIDRQYNVVGGGDVPFPLHGNHPAGSGNRNGSSSSPQTLDRHRHGRDGRRQSQGVSDEGEAGGGEFTPESRRPVFSGQPACVRPGGLKTRVTRHASAGPAEERGVWVLRFGGG